MKRIITAFLAMILLFSVFACAKPDSNDTEVNNPSGDQNTVREKIWDKKEYDFEGYVFTITSKANTGSIAGFNGCDINIDEITGNEVLDEVYNRNRLIESTYNCVIEQNDQVSSADAIRTILLGGSEEDCSLISTSAKIAVQLIPDDLLYDINDPSLVNLSLKQDWYDQDIQKDLGINGRLYMVNGDMLFVDDNSIWLTLFNKELANRYITDTNLYEAVKEGKWTLDLMAKYAAVATVELVADDKMNEFDQWGILTEPGDEAAHVAGCGYRFAEITPDGNIQMNATTPDFINIYTKCMQTYDPSFTLLSSDFKGYSDLWEEAYNPMFRDGRALFMVTSMYRCIMFREMQADFGILPLPKLNEEQQEYYSWMTWHTGVICVPYTCSDPERTSAIMEALFEESSFALKSAYRDKTIKYQSTRDDESIEILDIVFNNTVYDIGFIYDIGGVYSSLTAISKSHSVGAISSTINKCKTKITTDIEKIVEGYK